MLEVEIKKGKMVQKVKRVWYKSSSLKIETTNPTPTMSAKVKLEYRVLTLSGFTEFYKKPKDRDMWIKDTIIKDYSEGVETQVFFQDRGQAGKVEFEGMEESLEHYPCTIEKYNTLSICRCFLEGRIRSEIDKVVILYKNSQDRKLGMEYLDFIEAPEDIYTPKVNGMLNIICSQLK